MLQHNGLYYTLNSCTLTRPWLLSVFALWHKYCDIVQQYPVRTVSSSFIDQKRGKDRRNKYIYKENYIKTSLLRRLQAQTLPDEAWTNAAKKSAHKLLLLRIIIFNIPGEARKKYCLFLCNLCRNSQKTLVVSFFKKISFQFFSLLWMYCTREKIVTFLHIFLLTSTSEKQYCTDRQWARSHNVQIHSLNLT